MSHNFSETILEIVQRERERLLGLRDEDVNRRPSPDKWSKKEILGHLIDSASNNHQRFVRAQCSDKLSFPGYVGAEWVRCQDYADGDWQQLIGLWSAYNLHLAHVISRIPSEKLFVQCKIGQSDTMTLETLIADYIRHMEHHLRQLTMATMAR